MKIRYLKFKNWLLTLAAAALGINCTECAVEYGTPEATYHVKGTVSDPDGKPIPGIEVNHYGHPYDTTDPQGAYAFTLKSTLTAPKTAATKIPRSVFPLRACLSVGATVIGTKAKAI